jgi:hypothetical protein
MLGRHGLALSTDCSALNYEVQPVISDGVTIPAVICLPLTSVTDGKPVGFYFYQVELVNCGSFALACCSCHPGMHLQSDKIP